MSLRRMYILVAVCVLLSACAERWQKYGATEGDFEIMKAGCMARASGRFPPILHQEVARDAYYSAVHTNCRQDGPNTRCITTGGEYVPPRFVTIDSNEGLRDQDFRACFFENGWTPVRD